ALGAGDRQVEYLLRLHVRFDQPGKSERVGYALARRDVERASSREKRTAIVREDIGQLGDVGAGHELFGQRRRDLLWIDALEPNQAFVEGAHNRTHLLTARGHVGGSRRDAHEFIVTTEIFFRVFYSHEVDEGAGALLHQQRQCRLPYPGRIHFAQPHRIVDVGAEPRELDLFAVGAGRFHEIQGLRFGYVAARDDADDAPFEVLETLDLGDPLRCDRQRQQGQVAGRAKSPDVRAAVEGLENVVERRGRIVERAADERLRRGRAAAHIDELHVEALVAEKSAHARDLE